MSANGVVHGADGAGGDELGEDAPGEDALGEAATLSGSGAIAAGRRASPRELLLRVVRFGLVGGLATLVHAAMYAALVSARLVLPFTANTIAYLSAVSVSFVGHHRWTFAPGNGARASALDGRADTPRGGSARAAFVRYAVVSLLGYSMNAGFVTLVVSVLALDPMLALVPMLTVTPATAFVLSRHWAFRS